MNKLSLKLVKALGFAYIYLLVLTLSFAYIIRVNKVFIEVINYLSSYLEGVGSSRLVLSI